MRARIRSQQQKGVLDKMAAEAKSSSETLGVIVAQVRHREAPRLHASGHMSRCAQYDDCMQNIKESEVLAPCSPGVRRAV